MLKRKFFSVTYVQNIGTDYVIFSAGTSATKKYSIPNTTVASGTNLVTTGGASAAGNLTLGLFISGNSNQITSKYTFAGDGVVPGTNMGVSIGSTNPATAGNGTVCITAPGSNSSGTASTIKYTYAGDGVSAGTSLSASILTCSSTGNASFAIFQIPNGGALTNRYEYATDVRIAGPNMVSGTATSGNGSHSGDGTIGLIARGSSTLTNAFGLAANTCVAGTALAVSRTGRGMAGNASIGVFASGPGNPTLYTYAGATTVAGTALLAGVAGAGVCANPVGVNV